MYTIPEDLRREVTETIESENHKRILAFWDHTLDLDLSQAYYVAKRLICAGYGSGRRAAHGNNAHAHYETKRAMARIWNEGFLNVVRSDYFDDVTRAEFHTLVLSKPKW
jgi:hypothetical protein